MPVSHCYSLATTLKRNDLSLYADTEEMTGWIFREVKCAI